MIVTDHLKSNKLYTQSSIENPAEIFVNISENVSAATNVTVDVYNLTINNAFIYTSSTLESTTPSWSKTVYSNSTDIKTSGNVSASIQIPLNLEENLSLANAIDKELNVASSAPSLTINVTMVVAGIPVSSNSIEFILYSSYYYVTYSPAPVESHETYTSTLISPKVSSQIGAETAYALIGTGIAMAFVFVAIMLPKNRDEEKKIRKKYGNNAIEISVPPSENAIKITKTDDLFRMSEIFEVPIFLYLSGHTLYIDHNGTQYYVEVS